MDKHYLDGEDNRTLNGQFSNSYYNNIDHDAASRDGASEHTHYTQQDYTNNYDNRYSYYQRQDHVQHSDQYDNGGKKPSNKKKKSNKLWNQLAKVVCFALIFGLVAGGTFWGVVSLTDNRGYGSIGYCE